MQIAYFGLPLGALLLAADGHRITLAVLSPVAAVGARRLTRSLGAEPIVRVDAAGSFASVVTERLRTSKPDLLVSWFWTRRLPLAWIRAARLGGIGAHPSLLPRHRGPNPYFWAIDSGDPVSGVTIHRLTEEYDRGEILETRSLPVAELDAWQLARALDRPSLAAMRATVRRLERGQVTGSPQDEARATWAPEPSGDLLRVRWDWPSSRILRRIRALAPTPGLPLEIRGVRCWVTRAQPSNEVVAALLPGEACLARRGAPAVLIRTGDGAIEVGAAHVTSAVEDDGEGDGDVTKALDREELARVIFGGGVLDSPVGGP